MKELDLSEGKSTGIPTIQEELWNNGSPKAMFFTDDDRRAVTVEIPIHPDFINKKVDILLNTVELEQIFGRTEIINALNISPTAASKFIGKMYQAGILVPVEGKGKGKYQWSIL